MCHRRGGSGLVSSDDFRSAARRRLPKLFFDYLDGAAGAERTAAYNIADFDKIHFLPRVLCSATDRSLQSTFLGHRHDMPLMLGPIGSLGQFRAHAEESAFRAADAFGIPACLSSFSITNPEQLSRRLPGRAGFQLYVLRDFDRTERIIERVKSAGFGTLFVTVDTPVSGIRERDIRNGLRQNSRLTAANLLDILSRPAWLLDMVRIHPVRMALAENWPAAGSKYLTQAAFLANQIDPDLSWEKLRRVRSLWQGALIIKGIMRADDLQQAIDIGANGVVVSNHGGRQLDGCASTVSVLSSLPTTPPDFDVILDGGVRRGTDVLKAIALGATACSLGRAYACALAGGGEAGLFQFLDCFRQEMDASLALLGVRSLSELRHCGRDLLSFQPAAGVLDQIGTGLA